MTARREEDKAAAVRGNSEDRREVWTRAARNVAVISGLLAFALVLGVATYGILVIRETQLANKPKIDRTDDTLQAVKDLAEDINSCTNPKGECARRGQRNTGKAIASINQYGLYVVACADQPGQQTEVEIRACANRLQATAEKR